MSLDIGPEPQSVIKRLLMGLERFHSEFGLELGRKLIDGLGVGVGLDVYLL